MVYKAVCTGFTRGLRSQHTHSHEHGLNSGHQYLHPSYIFFLGLQRAEVCQRRVQCLLLVLVHAQERDVGATTREILSRVCTREWALQSRAAAEPVGGLRQSTCDAP